jgi:hypothetical protein
MIKAAGAVKLPTWHRYIATVSSSSPPPSRGAHTKDCTRHFHLTARPIILPSQRRMATTKPWASGKALTHSHRPLNRYTRQEPKWPVFARGWILQERFLSPRVLHFGPEELSWECFELGDCQCTENDWSASQVHINETRLNIARCAYPKMYYNESMWRILSPEWLSDVWRRLVEDYSALELTHEKDIFLAISGLARQFYAINDSVYLAGLWRHSFVKYLLWHLDTDHETESGWLKRPSWRAPSWSWASVNGPVEFLDTTRFWESECEVGLWARILPASWPKKLCAPAGPIDTRQNSPESSKGGTTHMGFDRPGHSERTHEESLGRLRLHRHHKY